METAGIADFKGNDHHLLDGRIGEGRAPKVQIGHVLVLGGLLGAEVDHEVDELGE